jgi:hypothetical protein
MPPVLCPRQRPGAHAPVVIGKSRFGNSQFLMHKVTDLAKPRTPICDATCHHLRVRLNTPTPVFHSVLSGNRESEFHGFKCAGSQDLQNSEPSIPLDPWTRVPHIEWLQPCREIADHAFHHARASCIQKPRFSDPRLFGISCHASSQMDGLNLPSRKLRIAIPTCKSPMLSETPISR